MVGAGDPSTDLPSELADDLDVDEEESGVFVLADRGRQVGSDRDSNAGEERRPDVNVVVALVAGGETSGTGDLSVFVFGEDVETIVVDADAVVGVARGDGDLDVGGENIGVSSEVEFVDRGVLEEEFGLRRAENKPDHEYNEEDDDD